MPTVNQSRGTLVNLLVGSLTPEEILDEAIACRTWKLLFACCDQVQDFDLASEIANFFPSPFSRRELLAFLRGVTLQDVERLKESDTTFTAEAQTHVSAAVQHVDSLMACLPEDVPESVPEACERLKQIQFPCVHRGLLGCIMACVFHGQSSDVKKAGGFVTTRVVFIFFVSNLEVLDSRYRTFSLERVAGWLKVLQMTLEDDPFYVGRRLVAVATLQTQEPEMQVRSWDDRSEVVEVTSLLVICNFLFRQKDCVFPERRFVAGFFRRLLAYLTPHISHTYPSHHTYPTHIHSKRILPIRIPPIRIRSIRIPPIRIRSTRIPPIRIHAMRIHSIRIHSKGLHQQEWQTYPTNTCPTNTYPFNTYPTSTYPFNAYPFKRFASAGMAMYVNAKHILACHCISRNGNEYEYHCMSFHTIATRREW